MFLFERNEDVMARLTADYPRNMAVPGGVLGEHHVAGSKSANCAVAGFDLDLSGQRDDILPFRRGGLVAQVGCRRAAKNDPMRGLQRGSFEMFVQVKFNFHFFEMRFVVRSGVKSDNLHQSACRKIGREKQGNEILFQSFKPFKSFQTFRLGAGKKMKPAEPEEFMCERTALSLLYCGGENSL